MRMLRSIVYSIVKVLTSHVRKVTKNSLSQLRQGFILDVPVSHDQIFSPQTTGIVKCVAKHVEDARVTYGVFVGSAKSGHAMRRARGSSGTGGFKARNQDRLAFAIARSVLFIHRLWYARIVQTKHRIHHI